MLRLAKSNEIVLNGVSDWDNAGSSAPKNTAITEAWTQGGHILTKTLRSVTPHSSHRLAITHPGHHSSKREEDTVAIQPTDQMHRRRMPEDTHEHHGMQTPKLKLPGAPTLSTFAASAVGFFGAPNGKDRNSTPIIPLQSRSKQRTKPVAVQLDLPQC
mmetsp:Transcript_15799/g.64539  ORF Transcript_15799/g.64539 Transcript_15799/m.64539 type:complete len:158 (-) Transcript_15799:2725-3198(-)